MAKAKKTKKAEARKRRARRIVTHAARVAAEELARADGDPDEDPENPFGDDEDEATVNNAPPPPPMSPLDEAKPPPATIVALGGPPEDPLAAQAWLHRVMIASAADAAIDPALSPRERRKELRTISAAAAKLLPHSRLYEAEQTIRKDREALEKKIASKQGAKLRPIPGTPLAVVNEPDSDG